MNAFRLRSTLAIAFALAFHTNSHAGEGIYGCWNNIQRVPVEYKYPTPHKGTTASGDIICFKKNGTISTVIVGGFEALGTEGLFSYGAGRLVLIKKDLADGWPFAFKIDHCNASVTPEQLTISGCKGPGAIILRRQTNSPDMTGVAAGVFQ